MTADWTPTGEQISRSSSRELVVVMTTDWTPTGEQIG